MLKFSVAQLLPVIEPIDAQVGNDYKNNFVDTVTKNWVRLLLEKLRISEH